MSRFLNFKESGFCVEKNIYSVECMEGVFIVFMLRADYKDIKL